MSCDDCTRSTETDWYGFRNGCKACEARAVSRGPEFHRARELNNKHDAGYQRVLARCGLKHAEVKDAFKVDCVNRKEIV